MKKPINLLGLSVFLYGVVVFPAMHHLELAHNHGEHDQDHDEHQCVICKMASTTLDVAPTFFSVSLDALPCGDAPVPEAGCRQVLLLSSICPRGPPTCA
jgi:hypothetical protein